MPKAAKKGAHCSSAGAKLAQCRWGKAKSKPKGKAKPKARKPKAPPPKQRASRRLAGKEPVRHPAGQVAPRKPRKKPKKGRAPVKPSYKAERKITGDATYGMSLYGKGVSVHDGAYKQFRQAGYDRDV